MRKPIISDEINAETKIFLGYSWEDLGIILGISIFALFSSDFFHIHPKLKLAYTLFWVILAFIFTLKSQKNPGKRLWESMVLSLTRQNTKRFEPTPYTKSNE